MDTRDLKIRKIFALALAVLVAALVITVLSIQTTLAEDEEDNEKRPEITVEVVEDIPAEDIEEQEVPLADSPDTAARSSTRMTVIAWTLGAVAIAYAVFIVSGMKLRKNRRLKRSGSGGDRDSAGGR